MCVVGMYFSPTAQQPVVHSWRIFWGRMHNLSVNYEENISRANGNFEEQNKFLKSFIIIINDCIIITRIEIV
jgi:hypothetical protein